MTMRLTKSDIPNLAAVALVLFSVVVPYSTTSPRAYSIMNQILVAIPAALSVFIMLRMNLVSFATPAFMALGAYTAAIMAMNGITNLLLISVASFITPMIIAIPLGILVLRLRGIYFVLVTYILTSIIALCLIEFKSITGGTDGIQGLPTLQLGAMKFSDSRDALIIALILAVSALAIAFATLAVFRRQFNGINENELLARSLGMPVWFYKAIGFSVAAGLGGMAGFSLVNELMTANPSSFTSENAVIYVAYAFVGGSGSLLGPVFGSALLVYIANCFSMSDGYFEGLFGLFIIVIVLIAPGGIVGQGARIIKKLYGIKKPEMVHAEH